MSIETFQGLEAVDVVSNVKEEVSSSIFKTSATALDVFQSLSNISAQSTLSSRKIYPITKTGFPNLFFAESKEAQEKLISNLESAIANILPKIRIPYLSKDKTFKFTGFFDEIEALIRKQDPQAVVYLGGGSIRSILSFIYKELYEAYNNDQDPQLLLSQICQGTANFSVQREDGTISSLDVLGVESDIDIYVQFSDRCFTQQEALNNAKKFINEGLQTLSESPYKALLCPLADIKEYKPQLQRASSNGGSPIDWLVFPLTSLSGSNFKVPDACPNVLENFCSGILTYKPVDHAENPCITTLRMYRSLFELPFLELSQEDNLRFIKDLQEVVSQGIHNASQKIQQVFEKIVRNTRFADRLNFEIKNEATDSCILERQKILTKISQKFESSKNLPALPELLPSCFRVQELDLESIKLLNDKNLFISPDQFINQYTANGILYHGTPDLKNVIPMIRGNLVISTETQGTAAYGRGFYSTKYPDIAKSYAGSEGQVLHFHVNQDKLTVVDLNAFPREILDLLIEKSDEKGLDFNEYLAKYLKIDIIINHHILIQNTRCISLGITQENFLEKAIFNKTKSAIEFFKDFKNEYAKQYSDYELFNHLKNLLLTSALSETISKEAFGELKDTVFRAWENADELAVLLVRKNLSFLENLLAYPKVRALMNERDFVLEALKQHCHISNHIGTQFKNDREIILAVVKEDGLALEFASDQLKNDKEIVLAAVEEQGRALEYASDQLKNDKEIALAAIKQTGWSFVYLSDQLKNNKEIVLAAVNQEGLILEYVSNQFKNDRDVVLEAVKKSGLALRYAGDQFKDNEEIVLEAILSRWFWEDGEFPLLLASERLKRKSVISYISNLLDGDFFPDIGSIFTKTETEKAKSIFGFLIEKKDILTIEEIAAYLEQEIVFPATDQDSIEVFGAEDIAEALIGLINILDLKS